jgi:hypothetical protein
MAEAALRTAEAPVDPLDGPAERLGREAGILAGRLAEVLDGLGARRDPPLSDAAEFLRSMYEAVAEGRPLAAWRDGPLTRRPAGAPQPLDRVVTALDLTPAEVDVVLLAGFPEEHEGYASVLRQLSPTGEPAASVGLAAQLLCEGPKERSLLRRTLECGSAIARGVVVAGPGPFCERSLTLAAGLWSVLCGLDVWPEPLRPLVGDVVASGLEEWLAAQPAARAATAIRRGSPVTVLVTADSERVASARALALVRQAGAETIELEFPPVPSPGLERLVGAHALARGIVPVLQLGESEPPDPAQAPGFVGHPAPVVVCGRTGATVARGTRPLIAVPVEPLSAIARRQMWTAVLPGLAASAPELASRHPIEPVEAGEAAADVRALEALDDRQARLADVSATVRARAGLSLAAGIKLIKPMARWHQLVLPGDKLAQLREALGRLAHQSRVLDEWGFLAGRPGARGVRMLFAGPPGTGKTLSAEVLAGELALELLVVDISRVVSKWIGETEKNLAEVFDAAERAQAVLFFDEADALFGKRTEVSDAHDRYANLETAYLLARLERFEGLAVLATNLRQNIDPAFTRRLEFVVDYEEPSVAEREALWRCHLPAGAPLAPDVDVAELASLYPVVGALIRNAAVAAAFVAAAENVPIARRHVAHAIRREYAKSGRAFPGVPTVSSP